MRDEYDFSNAVPSPWADLLKQSITIRIDTPTLEYFRTLAVELGVPYQSLINFYLRDCAMNKRRPDWT
jgi:predicted DNA binding CopG/RHH family protein